MTSRVCPSLNNAQRELLVRLSDASKEGLLIMLTETGLIGEGEPRAPSGYFKFGLLGRVMANLDNAELQLMLVANGFAAPQWFGVNLPDRRDRRISFTETA